MEDVAVCGTHAWIQAAYSPTRRHCNDWSVNHLSEDTCSFMCEELVERCFHGIEEEPELKWKKVILTILFCQCLSFSTSSGFHL